MTCMKTLKLMYVMNTPSPLLSCYVKKLRQFDKICSWEIYSSYELTFIFSVHEIPHEMYQFREKRGHVFFILSSICDVSLLLLEDFALKN